MSGPVLMMKYAPFPLSVHFQTVTMSVSCRLKTQADAPLSLGSSVMSPKNNSNGEVLFSARDYCLARIMRYKSKQ